MKLIRLSLKCGWTGTARQRKSMSKDTVWQRHESVCWNMKQVTQWGIGLSREGGSRVRCWHVADTPHLLG